MDNKILKKQKFKRRLKTVILVAVFFCFWGVFFAGGYAIGKITTGKVDLKVDPEFYETADLPNIFNDKLIKQVWAILKSDYAEPDKIEEEDLYYGAIKGFVSALDDPYTQFMEPTEAQEFDEIIAGEFEGIGAEISMKNDILTIVAPLPETPAEKAGLKPGDKIIMVDDQDIAGMSIDESIKLIKGPRGTEVRLMILREGENPREVSIVRDVIELKSLYSEMREDNIYYIHLSSFNADVRSMFNKEINKIEKQNPRGIILDLRNDPGGLLDGAVDVASAWVDGEVVVMEKFGDGRKIEYKATKGASLAGYPTVVLINEGSASASEIVAGALQDYDLAEIVGMTSFGKGSVQVLRKLPEGSSVKVTVAKWVTPLEREIDGQGIAPDVEIQFSEEDIEAERDVQLEKAVEIILNQNAQ